MDMKKPLFSGGNRGEHSLPSMLEAAERMMIRVIWSDISDPFPASPGRF
jgi:hypothetical protein